MTKMRKTHPLQTKIKVAIEAIKGEKTTSEITSKYGIHTTQINTWKKQALEQIPNAFSRNPNPDMELKLSIKSWFLDKLEFSSYNSNLNYLKFDVMCINFKNIHIYFQNHRLIPTFDKL